MKNNYIFGIDYSPPKTDTKADRNNGPQQYRPTSAPNVMFETLLATLAALITAIEANTAARSADAPAAAAPAKRGGKKTEASAKETPPAKDELDDDLDAPAPAKKKAITHEDIREVVKNARVQLRTSVSAEAAALHKTKTAEVLKKLNAESITKIADKDLEKAFNLISAIDCTTAADEDEDDL